MLMHGIVHVNVSVASWPVWDVVDSSTFASVLCARRELRRAPRRTTRAWGLRTRTRGSLRWGSLLPAASAGGTAPPGWPAWFPLGRCRPHGSGTMVGRTRGRGGRTRSSRRHRLRCSRRRRRHRFHRTAAPPWAGFGAPAKRDYFKEGHFRIPRNHWKLHFGHELWSGSETHPEPEFGHNNIIL